MNLLSLSWRYLWSRPLATALNLLLLTLGLATVAFVLLAQDRAGGLHYDGSTVFPPDRALWG